MQIRVVGSPPAEREDEDLVADDQPEPAADLPQPVSAASGPEDATEDGVADVDDPARESDPGGSDDTQPEPAGSTAGGEVVAAPAQPERPAAPAPGDEHRGGAAAVEPAPVASPGARRARQARAAAPASAFDGDALVSAPRQGRLRRALPSWPARRSQDADAVAAPLRGGTRFVPILSRKGGVGKTTVTALLGMSLATRRSDRVIAIDANPDRGTLADRVHATARYTARQLVDRADQVAGFTDLSAFIARDDTRLDVIASDADPRVSEAFDDADYDAVAELCSTYYSLVLTDCGTGIVHPAMTATLARADQIVVVAGLGLDDARLASETLTWLEAHGYGRVVEQAVVALVQQAPGKQAVDVAGIERHFADRVRGVVRVPFDRTLATGAAIDYEDLKPQTRRAADRLAALVVGGLAGAPTDRRGNRG